VLIIAYSRVTVSAALNRRGIQRNDRGTDKLYLHSDTHISDTFSDLFQPV
jgi:hypothetical protein